MITLHHLNNSRSQRIIWLLETLAVDYQIKTYQRNSETSLAPEALLEIHPLGKSPVITDGQRTIAESGLIIEYLAQSYRQNVDLLPEQGSEAHWQYLYWLHYAEGSLMPFMVMTLVFEKIKTAPMPFFIRPVAKAIADKAIAGYAGPNLIKNLQYVDDYLEGKTWFAGDKITGADIQMIFPLEAAISRGDARKQYSNIAGYVDRIHQLESYQKALEKGGPYDYA